MGMMKQIVTEVEDLLHMACERFPQASQDELAGFRFMAQTGAMCATTRPPTWPHHYHSYEELVLNEGTLGTWRPRPDHVEKMPDKHCFSNALELAFSEGYHYVEGYASSLIVINHAWCEDDDGTVIDPTWDEVPERPFYMGLRTDPYKAQAWMASTGYFGLIGNDWMRLQKNLPTLLDGAHQLRR